MTTLGLEASRFANQGSFQYVPRPGDWQCQSCNFSNFASRTSCYRCFEAKPGMKINDKHIRQENLPPGNFAIVDPALYQKPPAYTASYLMAPVQCPTPPSPFPERADEVGKTSFLADDLVARYGGLATSRWAPRNYRHGGNGRGGSHVWTRTVQVDRSHSVSNEPHPPPTHPDLGLPYEVQHYILTMMQRLLEEGCYSFASHWLPQTLRAKNLTCSEAVELSEWRKLLPEHAPPRALHPPPNKTLERMLGNAVRIRNAAVHRHLCDNGEIRRMASQAQDLMSTFRDVTRAHKFMYLRGELEEWDRLSAVDLEGARERLEGVLMQVGEREVSDMDWTPNLVSLEEVGRVSEHSSVSDEMDID